MTVNSALFQPDRSLDREEKFALLNFMACEFGLENSLTLAGPNFRNIAEFKCRQASRLRNKIDLLWIDLNAQCEFDTSLPGEIGQYLSKKAIICIDGGSNFIKKVTQVLGDYFVCIFDVSNFKILGQRDGVRSVQSIYYQIDLFRRKYFFTKEQIVHCNRERGLPVVAVIILTYNHEKYIRECLKSVLTQKGDFRLRVIVSDDASTDHTAEVIRNTIAGWHDDNLSIEFQSKSENCGVVKNLFSSVRMASGCDYFTFCEGDDFWSSDTRIKEHIDFLSYRPECVMSFNTIEFCSADGLSRLINNEYAAFGAELLDGNVLAEYNVIGNFSACFYKGELIKILPESLFDIYTVDWMFNLYCSQFGGIGYLKKSLTVYRQHCGAEWSSREEFDKANCLLKLIDQYNTYLDFQYNKGFQKYKKMLLEYLSLNHLERTEKIELLIFDDVFPSPCSGFRLAEFTAYLKEFPRSLVLTSGVSVLLLGDEPLDPILKNFQRKFPELGNQVMESNAVFPIKLGKLLYVNFLNNAYALLPIAEEAEVPFAFTLYPGGGFVLNNPECDRKLKRVFDSPCFRKVIVTQQITHDYLINQRLCTPEKIKSIFGVVMPQDSFFQPIPKGKVRWGFGKKRLDLCFMAHRYTPLGVDKGYDVFINTALQLRNLHDDIYYHIVGQFDRRVIDVSPIHDHIQFYGVLKPEDLDDFFKDMDIILSPNISGKISSGSFDGFPTASCTEGGLRGVAIFCTDEFNSAAGKFVDGQDFVSINYDVAHIVRKIEHYYRNPTQLKAIGEYGSKKIMNLYSHDAQIVSRISFLRELIDFPFIFDQAIWRKLKPCSPLCPTNPLIRGPLPSPFWTFLKKHSPESVKNIYRKLIRRFNGLRYVS